MTVDIIPTLILKPGREKPIIRQHPWIFSGAIEKIIGNPGCGDLVNIQSANSESLGIGAFSPQSQIRCRMWGFGENHYAKDEYLVDLLRDRIETAFRLRKLNPCLISTNSYRIINAESDYLPGLIVDLYDDILVVQFLSCGPEKYRKEIIKLLREVIGIKTIFERSDVDVRELEGLLPRTGNLLGNEVTQLKMIEEFGLRFFVDVANGHKTGFYLDQRTNRNMLRKFTADKEVLDCFCYSGGFTINALAGRARKVTAVDVSETSLSLVKQNAILNGFSREKIETVQNDVFKQLRTFRDESRFFDVIILDPPKFAPTKKQVRAASRGYKDINLLAIKLLRAGGILFTFSCSGGIDKNLFQKIVADSAEDAGAEVQIIERLCQASDHPVRLSFPEGEYLKGLICRKI